MLGEGSRFSVANTPDPNVGDDRFMGLTAAGEQETWAVGSTLDDASGNLETLIVTGGEHGAWTQVPSPSPATDGDNQLAAVAKAGDHDLWAVGGFDGPDALQTLVLHRCR